MAVNKGKLVNASNNKTIRSTKSHRHHYADSIYVKKVLPGGILVFELGLRAPFVFMKIHALADKSLSNIPNDLITDDSLRKSLIRKIAEVCCSVRVSTSILHILRAVSNALCMIMKRVFFQKINFLIVFPFFRILFKSVPHTHTNILRVHQKFSTL